jgi:diguanylate cyclase (GGDEF)-like protein
MLNDSTTEGAMEGRQAMPEPGRRLDADRERSVSSPAADTDHALAAEVARLEGELTEMRARLRELEARAELDPLTEVFNRRGFERELKRVMAYVERYGGSVALVYLDLDDFKPVNDRYGHAAGDVVLRAIASALTRCVRASDAVARLGGDEFVLLLWNLSERAALTKAESLERAIAAQAVPIGQATISVGASAGVTMLAHGDTLTDVLARADAAMYARKAATQGAR